MKLGDHTCIILNAFFCLCPVALIQTLFSIIICEVKSRHTEINGENPYQPCAKMLPLFITNYKIAFLPNRGLISTWSETYLKLSHVFIKSAGANKLVKRPVVVSCVTSVTRVTLHACRRQYMYARRAAGRKQPPVRLPLSRLLGSN